MNQVRERTGRVANRHAGDLGSVRRPKPPRPRPWRRLARTRREKSQPTGGRSRCSAALARALQGTKKETIVPPLAGSAPDVELPIADLDEPLDPKVANRPLEPGSGAPDLNAIMKRVRDERGPPVRAGKADAAKSDFIAAARRAAQAAAAEAEVLKRQSTIRAAR